MKIKSVLRTCTAAIMLSAAMTAAVSAADSVSVTINGTALECDTPAQIVEGRTMVPLRAIFEALGAEIDWNANEKTVTAQKDGTVIRMTIGAPSFDKNGESVALDTPAMVIDSRTMVPARAVSESMGCDVKWDALTKTVIISMPDAPQVATEATTETTTVTETKTDNKEKTTAENQAEVPEWVAAFSDMKRPAPVSDELTKKNDMHDLHGAVRYTFEQVALPTSIHEDEKNAINALKDRAAFEKYVKDCWTEVKELGILYYVAEVDKKVYVISSEEDIDKLVADFTKKAELDPEKNIKVQTAETDNGYIGIIGLANDYNDLCCAYIAVRYDKDKGIKVYTLEYDQYLDDYLVCFTTGEVRGNYSIVISKEMAENPEGFLKAINMIEKEGMAPVSKMSLE